MFLTTSTRYGSNDRGATYTVEKFDSAREAREAFDHNIECDTWILPGEWKNENVHVIEITGYQVMTIWQDTEGKVFCVITYTLTSGYPITGF